MFLYCGGGLVCTRYAVFIVLIIKSLIDNSCFAGLEWHPRIRSERHHFIYNDLPRFIMDSYEECSDPPRLHLLDKYIHFLYIFLLYLVVVKFKFVFWPLHTYMIEPSLVQIWYWWSRIMFKEIFRSNIFQKSIRYPWRSKCWETAKR